MCIRRQLIFQAALPALSNAEIAVRESHSTERTKFSLAGSIKRSPLHACKLTWLVLGGDPAVRSRRVEQFTAL